MADQILIRAYSRTLQINRPIPGGTVLELPVAGQITVFVEVHSINAQEVYAWVHEPGFTPPPAPAAAGTPPDAGYTQLTAHSATDYSKAVPVPAGHLCAVTAPATDNLAVTVISKMTNGLWSPDVYRATFKGVCTTTYVDVPATACPWFAYADDDVLGPEGEVIAAHRPVRVRVPDGAANVTITASGMWRHAPVVAATSGPEGYGNPQPLANPAYRHPIYTLGAIQDPAANPKVNTLVGLLQPIAGVNTQIFEIGQTCPANPIALANIKGIFFGLWDGRQWTTGISNSGSVSVKLVWG